MKKVLITVALEIGLALTTSATLWAQAEPAATAPVTTDTSVDNRMLTPPPVNGQTYPTVGTAESRSNYLRGGVTFSTAYTDNVLGGASTKPVSDIIYSVWPTIALDETTPRLGFTGTYSPGFSYYQKTSGYNQESQNAGISLQYRLSQHVTVNFRDSFQKSSNIFNQPTADNAVSGLPTGPTQTVVAPLADALTNTGSGGISYQFAASSMIGANGNFSNLHYPNSSQVPGLSDSASQGGSVFYNHRLSKHHYLGSMYQYQRLLAYPTGGQSETQTHAVVLFYTLYITQRLSFSFSGGPQHADTMQTPLPATKSWNPMVTGSFGWQGQHTAISASYFHMVSAGGGLTGAVHTDTGNLSLQHQITRMLNAGITGAYSDTKLLAAFLPGTAGHSITGTATLQRQFGQHFSLSAAYTRLHQSYAEIPLITNHPDTNRESISISYNFTRPLGR